MMEKNEQQEEVNQKDEQVQENTVETAENLPEAEGEPEGQKNEQMKLQSEIAEQKDKYLRLYSEFENFRRRTAKEKIELIQSGNEQLIQAFLPVIDDFERAEKAVKEGNEKEVEGFLLIQNKFRKILGQYGVKPIEVGPGSEFNTDVHEAITQIPAPDASLIGKVVDVVEKGYLLNEKVIRFAKVVVGG